MILTQPYFSLQKRFKNQDYGEVHIMEMNGANSEAEM